MPLRSEKIFSDIPLNLDVHPVTKDLLRVTNNNAVKQAVKILVLTNFYERLYQPRLGSNVPDQLFENFDPLTEEDVKEGIEQVLRNFEPRCELLGVEVNADEDRNTLIATIEFRVINQVDPTSVDVFLERIR